MSERGSGIGCTCLAIFMVVTAFGVVLGVIAFVKDSFGWATSLPAQSWQVLAGVVGVVVIGGLLIKLILFTDWSDRR